MYIFFKMNTFYQIFMNFIHFEKSRMLIISTYLILEARNNRILNLFRVLSTTKAQLMFRYKTL